MDLKDLRLKLNWDMVKDLRCLIKKKNFKYSTYYACQLDPFQGKDWQLIFHFVVGDGKDNFVTSVRMHIDADPLFDKQAHWITDRRADIMEKKQSYDPLTLARIRLMRIVYDLCDDMEHRYKETVDRYKLDKGDVQLEIFDSGQVHYYN